ncbi:hypothetical protein PanWU01x14_196740 [Parasponia andersonii]|uniref:Uncharacterized protein n=1 Tax=Parasponia andersonii TaxID=3476 RepID=A0A2P5BZF0_PARAD|nr:hypothetical protein PanWU01x14_196740 [Parasponia andersonii]
MILQHCTAGQMLFAAAEWQRYAQMTFFPTFLHVGPTMRKVMMWHGRMLTLQGNLVDQVPRGGSAGGL